MAEIARRETVIEAIEAAKRNLQRWAPGTADYVGERRRLERLRNILSAQQNLTQSR